MNTSTCGNALQTANQAFKIGSEDNALSITGKVGGKLFTSTTLAIAATVETIVFVALTALAALPLYLTSNQDALDSLVEHTQLAYGTIGDAVVSIAECYSQEEKQPTKSKFEQAKAKTHAVIQTALDKTIHFGKTVLVKAKEHQKALAIGALGTLSVIGAVSTYSYVYGMPTFLESAFGWIASCFTKQSSLTDVLPAMPKITFDTSFLSGSLSLISGVAAIALAVIGIGVCARKGGVEYLIGRAKALLPGSTSATPKTPQNWLSKLLGKSRMKKNDAKDKEPSGNNINSKTTENSDNKTDKKNTGWSSGFKLVKSKNKDKDKDPSATSTTTTTTTTTSNTENV